MNAYRINTKKKLFSFGDPILECPVMGITLKEFQEIAIAQAGLKLIDVDDPSTIIDEYYFTFDADLIFTGAFAKECVTAAGTCITNLKFKLVENTFNLRYLFAHSEDKALPWVYNFNYHHQGATTTETRGVRQNLFQNYITVPGQMVPSGKYHFDQCEVWISRIASPFHLLYANLALNFGRSIKVQKILPQWMRERFFPIGSRPFYWALRRMNKIGKGCRIHPSAILEGVELGDNVTIGANCVLRMTKVGSGTYMEDNVILTYCVIGKNNFFSGNNFINVCMTYDNVFLIHGPYQFSIYGRGVAVMATINCDMRLDNKNIVIPTDVGMVDSGQTLLGIAYGHGSMVGGGNIIAPGRIVPNGLKVSPPADTIITKFDKHVAE